MTAARLPLEDVLVRELQNLKAWRDRVREEVARLDDAEYDDETGEPVNRAAEVESALAIAAEEVDEVIGLLQGIADE